MFLLFLSLLAAFFKDDGETGEVLKGDRDFRFRPFAFFGSFERNLVFREDLLIGIKLGAFIDQDGEVAISAIAV